MTTGLLLNELTHVPVKEIMPTKLLYWA
uniref:Uncharacterized protein n=1 Tax=Moniliophthora roreri TaxID=221103 RepID=A0A0W0G0H9_MONRR